MALTKESFDQAFWLCPHNIKTLMDWSIEQSGTSGDVAADIERLDRVTEGLFDVQGELAKVMAGMVQDMQTLADLYRQLDARVTALENK